MENVIKFEIIQILCRNNSVVQEIKKKNVLKVNSFNYQIKFAMISIFIIFLKLSFEL